MQRLKSLVSAVIVAIVLVASLDYVASAATGNPFILGKINKAKKTTTLKTSKGAALSLKTKSSQPPLKVNSDKVVKNLNADKIDGKSASQLGVRMRAEEFTMTSGGATGQTFTVPNVPAGKYLVSFSLWLYLDDNVGGYCDVYDEDGGYTAYSAGPARGDGYFPNSGIGALSLTTTQSVTLNCAFTANTTVSTYRTGLLMLTPLDSQSGSVLPRMAPRKGGSAPDARVNGGTK